MGYCTRSKLQFLDDIHQSKRYCTTVKPAIYCRHQPRTWQIANEKAAPYKTGKFY